MSGETKEDPRLKALRKGQTTKFASHEALPNDGVGWFGRYGPVSLGRSFPELANKLPSEMVHYVPNLRSDGQNFGRQMMQLNRDRGDLMRHIKAVGRKKRRMIKMKSIQKENS